ncbi:MAG TPA: tetratricopeptide repeat-containing sensor histidine kinase [Chryseosolibacter sp.]|nr:tetratricopeptide repeat-containing sensor histidine kinase [Chryseosolibacter sp.]
MENNFRLDIVLKPLIYILFCLSVFPQVTFSQTPRIDSLDAQLKKPLSDSLRAQTLILLSRYTHYMDYNKSKRCLDEALAILSHTNYKSVRAMAYEELGALYTLAGNYTSALKNDNLALQLNLEIKDSIGIASNYNSLGNDYHDLGEYDKAYYYLTQSYRIANELQEPLTMTISLHNIGRVFKELRQFDRAMSYLKQSQILSDSIDDEEGLPYSLDEIGDVQLRKGEYDSALATLTKALEIARELRVRELEPRTLARIATIYHKKKNYPLAFAYYDTAYQLHQRTNNTFGMAEIDLGRGMIYAEQEKTAEAISYIEKVLAVAKKLNARKLESECYNQLTKIWEQRGDYKRSLAFFRQHKILEDSLFSHDMQEKLLQDQLQFETEAKDSQIAALRTLQEAQDDQLKKQEFIRNILVVVMALSVILLATVYRSGQRRRQINTLLLHHQEEMEKRSEELERLNQVKDKFFSIISHDLRSPINALSGLLDLLDKGAVKPEELPVHIGELKVRFNHTRTLLNNLLDWTLLQMDKLNLQPSKIDLYRIVEENIQLLGSVQTKQITLVNKIKPESFAFADSNTINLVIRNLVTNAIKFTKDKGEVFITADARESQWLISVMDNGIGMNNDVLKILFDKTAPYTTRGTANEKGTGLGLILCKEFVEKNGGKIWVESVERKGSTFYFTLPKAG